MERYIDVCTSKRQTDRQTDGRADRQTTILTTSNRDSNRPVSSDKKDKQTNRKEGKPIAIFVVIACFQFAFQ